jgi:hypothetical protein
MLQAYLAWGVRSSDFVDQDKPERHRQARALVMEILIDAVAPTMHTNNPAAYANSWTAAAQRLGVEELRR